MIASQVKAVLEPVLEAETRARSGQISAAIHTAPRAVLRVLHVFTNAAVGGTEYGVLKVVRGLDRELFSHQLCAIRGRSGGLSGVEEFGTELLVAGRSHAGAQFPLFRLARLMRQVRPHIVHSRNWGAIEAIPAARLAGVPVVIHSEHGYELDMLEGLPLRRRLLRRAVYPLADAVFTVTRDLRDYHARQAWTRAEAIRVIYNGVDTQRFAPRPEQRARVRRELGLPADAFVVGSVGRMVAIKDYGTLLRAARELIGRGVMAFVVLAGDGPELAVLQRQVESTPELAGRVVFIGSSDRVPQMLNVLDAFVLTSVCEGMSNTLLEAMASGLPVVATRVGGNPEVVGEEFTEWLLPPGDATALSMLLLRLAEDEPLRNQLGARARQRAVEVFPIERMLTSYQDLYLELVARRGLPRRSEA